MSLQITSFDELDTTRVAELLALFSAWMQEKHPDVELSRGVFHDLVLYFNSVLNAALRENVNRVMQSNSLLAISQNPDLADDTIVDNVLSNFNVSRGTGAAAEGEAMVVVGQYVSTQITSNTRLTANGVSFYPTATFIGVTDTDANNEAVNSRPLVQTQNGAYAFKIPVVAVVNGTAGNISKGTTLTPDAAPSNVKAIFAAADFVKGSEPLTNSEYIAKLSNGLSAKTIGGRKSFGALIRSQGAFSTTRHISVVGFGDAEQQRDQRGLFPISGGGRVDIYVQTSDTPQVSDNIVYARYIGPADPALPTSGTIWEMTIDRDIYPGFYNVLRIAKIPGTAAESINPSTYEIISRTPGLNFKAGEYKPDILTPLEGSFTRYKQEVVRFVNTDIYPASSMNVNTWLPYVLKLVGMPLIGAIQDFLSDPDIRCRTADVIVRAAVPCFTTIGLTIRKAPTDPDLVATGAVANMKAAIVNAVSKLGFAGALSASTITNAVAPYLTAQQSAYSFDIFGKILRPDGKIMYVRDPDQIVVPNEPQHLVSAKTVVFLTSLNDIAINTVPAAAFGD